MFKMYKIWEDDEDEDDEAEEGDKKEEEDEAMIPQQFSKIQVQRYSYNKVKCTELNFLIQTQLML